MAKRVETFSFDSETDKDIARGLAGLPNRGKASTLNTLDYNGTMMLEVFYSVDRLEQVIEEGCAGRLTRIVALANGGGVY